MNKSHLIVIASVIVLAVAVLAAAVFWQIARGNHSETGDELAVPVVSQNQFGTYEVDLQFNARGRRDFARITAENVGRRLAIVLDGAVYSAPQINHQIFAAPPYRLDASVDAAGNQSFDVDRTAQARLAHLNLQNPGTDQLQMQGATDGFHFRQFGHRSIAPIAIFIYSVF